MSLQIGLAYPHGEALDSLLDCYPNSLLAMLQVTALDKSFSKPDLDPRSPDFSIVSMRITFGGLVQKIQVLVMTHLIEKETERISGYVEETLSQFIKVEI